mgnify:CR=1 FL=1
MLVPTTIAGSLAQARVAGAGPSTLGAVAARRRKAGRGQARRGTAGALFDQEHAGIDIVTDGEQTRRHFVTTLIENLEGVDFQHKRTVRIRNRYDADVPVRRRTRRAYASRSTSTTRVSCAARPLAG